MRFTEQYILLKRIDFFIKKKATGSALELAKKLNISRATLFRQFSNLKILGAKISYCSSRKTYFYEDNFSF